MTARLNVNIDHVATVRQARRAPEPSVVAAAMLCEEAGADGITVHLRGDRRHIQDEDIYALRRAVTTYLNVEMAATEEMTAVARDARPDAVTLVAERPDEVTTEGGLDAVSNFDLVRRSVDELSEASLFVSLFIDPEERQIEAAHNAGARQIELCTAVYAETTLGARAVHSEGRARAVPEPQPLRQAAALARLHGAAGPGLPFRNVSEVAAIREIPGFNLGPNIVPPAVLTGLAEAVREMR